MSCSSAYGNQLDLFHLSSLRCSVVLGHLQSQELQILCAHLKSATHLADPSVSEQEMSLDRPECLPAT